MHGSSAAWSSITRSVFIFLAHQLNAALGTSFCAAALVSFVSALLSFAGYKGIDFVLQGPIFPVQTSVALLMGLSWGLTLRHRAMTWVWLLPTVGLIVLVITYPTFSLPFPAHARLDQGALSHYFGWGCAWPMDSVLADRPAMYCPDQMATTMPFYAGIGYSLGALLARRLLLKAGEASKTQLWIPACLGVLLFAAGVQHVLTILYFVATGTNVFEQFGPRDPYVVLVSMIIIGLPALLGGYMVRLTWQTRQRTLHVSTSLPE